LALGDIHLRVVWQVWHLATLTFVFAWQAWWRAWSPVTPPNFAWQAWHLATSTFVSRGRCVALGHIYLRFAWQGWTGLALVVRLGALGRAWSRMTPPNFAWQSWHLATSIFVSRGCGTCLHPPAFCVEGVALGHFHFGPGDVLRFAWQVLGAPL